MDAKLARSIIQYYYLQGLSPKQIKDKIDESDTEINPSYSTVKYWVAEFKRGRQSTQDEARSGRPVEVSTPEIIEQVKALVEKNRRTSCRVLADELSISKFTIHKILTIDLGMKKLLARWVPKSLSDSEKENRVKIARSFLRLWRPKWDEFLSRIITVDETWIPLESQGTMQSTSEWRLPTEGRPTRARLSNNRQKVMATVFWDTEGVILVDFFKKPKESKKRGMDAAYYAKLIQNLRDLLPIKRRGKLARGVLLLQDNAPIHTAAEVRAILNRNNFELLPHPPYSPDIAPSDYHLFPNLKNHLSDKKFADQSELLQGLKAYFEAQPKSFYLSGIDRLKDRLKTVIQMKGEHLS